MFESEKYILRRINECLSEVDPFFLHEQKNKIILFVPKIAIDCLINIFNRNIKNYNYPISETNGVLKFKEITISLGYEPAIVLAHIDSTLDEFLINKLSL